MNESCTDGSAGEASPGRDPVTAAARVLGRKWHLVVVGRLLAGEPVGFAALERSIQGIAGSTLSRTLQTLEDAGIVSRRVVDDRPVRVAYALTDCGRSLRPVVEAVESWEADHLRPVADPERATIRVPN